MTVTATKSVHFPKLNWGINAGATRELPADKAAQEIILAHSAIRKVADKRTEGATSNNQKQ